MIRIVHKAEDRGVSEHGWLSSRFSFSFAEWYEPSRMGFGALRVINDDTIAPHSGFPPHPHRDMEIITIVTHGAVTHKDSMGNEGVISAGEVQVMSAGTGVMHAEINGDDEELRLFQIWIEPKLSSIVPRYDQQNFSLQKHPDGRTLLVSPEGEEEGASLTINQDAYLSWLELPEEETHIYELHRPGFGLYALVVEGEVVIDGEPLSSRDAIGLAGMKEPTQIVAKTSTTVLLIEVPIV